MKRFVRESPRFLPKTEPLISIRSGSGTFIGPFQLPLIFSPRS
uniref:Uncharacterized protein n=1 Tax=Ascaris lumbricoides TaxID=6252 RepID=A0A0M3IT91_ASCLU